MGRPREFFPKPRHPPPPDTYPQQDPGTYVSLAPAVAGCAHLETDGNAVLAPRTTDDANVCLLTSSWPNAEAPDAAPFFLCFPVGNEEKDITELSETLPL